MAEEVRTDAGIGESIGTAGTAVKDGIVSGLKGVQEIETEIVNLVRSTMSDTLQATGSVASETVTVVRDVVKGTLQATEEVGTGLIVSTTNVTQGLVMGARDVGGDVLTTVHQAAKGTVAGVVLKHRGNQARTMDLLYLAALNRLPTSREYSLVSQRSKINIGATDLKNPLAPWQDLFWALVNSNEFILNH